MDAKSWKVLVYATDGGLSAMCGQLVAMLGSEVEEIHESTIALELARKRAFDLIIADWASLPEPRQEQLEHLHRANSSAAPRLLITCDEQHIDSAQTFESALILTKPVDPEVLRAAISESLSRLDQSSTEPELQREDGATESLEGAEGKRISDKEVEPDLGEPSGLDDNADYEAAHPPFEEVAVNGSLLNDDATATDRIKEPTVSKTGMPKSEASIIKALDELAGLANAAEEPEDRTQPNAQLTDFDQVHTEDGADEQINEPLAVPVAEDDSFDPFDDFSESELDQTQPDAILDLASSSPSPGEESPSEPDEGEPEPAVEEPEIDADATCEEEDLAPLLYALHEEECNEKAEGSAEEPISEASSEQPAPLVVETPIATESISEASSEQPAPPVVAAPIATEPEAEKRPSWQPPESEALSHEFIMVGGVPSDAPPSPPPVIIDGGNQPHEPEQSTTPSPTPLTATEKPEEEREQRPSQPPARASRHPSQPPAQATPPPVQRVEESGNDRAEAESPAGSPCSEAEQALPAAGKLKALPLYQLLATVLTEKVSGTLTLNRADKEVTFFFDSGRLIGFESDASEFEIIPWLLSEKLVDSAAGEEALLESFATGADQIELVFRRQLLEPIQIDSAMSDHLAQICKTTIGWGRGTFTFKGGRPKPSGPPISSPNIAKLIFEGMVAHASERHIIRCAELPDQAAALPKKDAPIDPKDIPVPPKIARVCELALGSVGMGDIVECGVLNRHQTLAVVRALKALNTIEIDSSGESAQPAPRKSCEPPRPSGTPLARITKPPPQVETPPPQSTKPQSSATARSRSSRPAPAPSAQPSTASSAGPAQTTPPQPSKSPSPPRPSASPKPPAATDEAPKSGPQPTTAQRRKTVEELMDREVDVKREMKAILTDYVEEQKKEKQRSGKKKGLLSRLLGDE